MFLRSFKDAHVCFIGPNLWYSHCRNSSPAYLALRKNRFVSVAIRVEEFNLTLRGSYLDQDVQQRLPIVVLNYEMRVHMGVDRSAGNRCNSAFSRNTIRAPALKLIAVIIWPSGSSKCLARILPPKQIE